jgi:hypothetical protein
MRPSTLHDLYSAGDDPRDLVKEPPVCDACGIALEAGEIDECQLCTNEFFVCPECKGRGYIAQSRFCARGECGPQCRCQCSCCLGEGRLLLSNREGLALELAPVPPAKPVRCCSSGYVRPGMTTCLACWGDWQDALEARGE